MAALDQDFYDELVAADGQPRAARAHARRGAGGARPRGADAGRPPPRRDLHAAGDHVRRRRARRSARSATARSRSTSCRGSSPPSEWTTIKRGLAQRIRALNHFVDDVYHAREIIHDGKVPWELVVSRPAFARAAHGIRPPGGVYCHVSGCDLVRDADGAWKVLEDNVRTPSGISYVLENRRAMTRLLPGLFEHYRVRPVDHYPALLRTALEEVAPTGGEEEATVVVWTPGPVQQRLLRARVPGAPDGRRARRGLRPRGPRRGLPHPHHPRPAARPRDLPPDRRRLHGPARVPAGLRARRPGADARLPRGQRRDRQRRRHRRRRRQGDLPLRPGDDPLLPRRGAAARRTCRRT